MSVKEIETAIAKLSADDLAQLAIWFEEFHAKAWDAQWEADVKARRLDEPARQARKDLAAGKCTPL